MKIKDLMKLFNNMEEKDLERDLVLWKWNDKKKISESEFFILNPTLNPNCLSKNLYALTTYGKIEALRED